MKLDEARDIVNQLLPDIRYQHTLRVVECASSLARKYGEDVERIELAAMLHDLAKYFSKEQMKQLIEKRPDYNQDVLNYHLSLWHAPAGAIYAEEELAITDKDILNGILYHTTGRKKMSRFEKIIFLADYIEPGRDFPGVQETRILADQNLDAAVTMALQKTIQYLTGRQQQVYPDTIDAYNEMILISRRHVNDFE